MQRGIACPSCGSAMRVVRTRQRRGYIVRRRRCDCGAAITTTERPAGAGVGKEGTISALGGISVADLLRMAGFSTDITPPSITFSKEGKPHGLNPPASRGR